MMDLARRIDELWEADELDESSIEEAIAALDRGEARVAEPSEAGWVVNEWTKKAILLYFRLRKVEPMEVGGLHFLDKIPVKSDYAARGVRVVPPGVARYGSYLAEGVVSHHLLEIHHVRPGPDQLAYDLGFLVFGAGLLCAGWLLARSARRSVEEGDPTPFARADPG